jgi:hypothetical protein
VANKGPFYSLAIGWPLYHFRSDIAFHAAEFREFVKIQLALEAEARRQRQNARAMADRWEADPAAMRKLEEAARKTRADDAALQRREEEAYKASQALLIQARQRREAEARQR